MSGSPLGKHSVVGFNNLWNNVLLEMFNVDSLSQQEEKWVEKVDIGKKKEQKT